MGPVQSVSALCASIFGLLAVSAAAQDASEPESQPQQAQPAEDASVTVEIIDAQGNAVGTVRINQLAHGVVFVADLKNLPPGGHGFHVHERGACEPPDFQSAGGHYSPLGHEHGFDNPQGYHAGDLPTIYVSEQGTAMAEFFARQLTLEPDPAQVADLDPFATADEGPFTMLDDDGSAIMIHRDPDDYEALPPDSTGPRIACGVIQAP